MVNKLKRKIMSKGLKQVWLANKLEIHEVDMSRYVNGATYPIKKTRNKIANYFHTNVDDLFPPQPKRKFKRRKRRKRAVRAVIPIPEGFIKI